MPIIEREKGFDDVLFGNTCIGHERTMTADQLVAYGDELELGNNITSFYSNISSKVSNPTSLRMSTLGT